MDEPVEPVVIGMDPHKRTVTVEVMTLDETIVGHARFTTDGVGFAAMVEYAQQWPAHTWAIEGCEGIGRHVAQRLIPLGEQVVDVPAKLSARMRMFATGRAARPTTPTRTPLLWSGSGSRACNRWSTTSTSRCSGSWSTGDDASVRTTPGWCASCTNCCWK